MNLNAVEVRDDGKEYLCGFELGKVHCVDSREVLFSMPSDCVDAVVTDPPYGISFQCGTRKERLPVIAGDSDDYPLWAIAQSIRLSRRYSYLFCRWRNLPDILSHASKHMLGHPKSIISWVKNGVAEGLGDLKHEHAKLWECILFYPGEMHEFTVRPPDVLFFPVPVGKERIHPTQKPVKLIHELLFCNKGDLILDPFAGVGTTLVAAKRLGKKFIGFEIDRKFCDLANERLESENKIYPLLEQIELWQNELEGSRMEVKMYRCDATNKIVDKVVPVVLSIDGQPLINAAGDPINEIGTDAAVRLAEFVANGCRATRAKKIKAEEPDQA